jgi:DNA-binding response OmpR family regulator
VHRSRRDDAEDRWAGGDPDDPPADASPDHHADGARRRARPHRWSAGGCRRLREQADLELDLDARSAKRGERWISFSTREFDLVATLLRYPQRVFTREELLDLVWGIDRDVTRNTVETYISYVRAKVDTENEPRLLHTIRGVGYSIRSETH